MKVFKVIDPQGGVPAYRSTKSEAHECAKGFPKLLWLEVYIEEREIPTHKTAFLALLNGDTLPGELLFTLGLTPRGGLRPVSNEEMGS